MSTDYNAQSRSANSESLTALIPPDRQVGEILLRDLGRAGLLGKVR